MDSRDHTLLLLASIGLLALAAGYFLLRHVAYVCLFILSEVDHCRMGQTRR
jgi:hypothetical protein